MAKKILVFVEMRDGALKSSSMEAVAAQAGARFEDLDFDGKIVLAEDLGCVAVSR